MPTEAELVQIYANARDGYTPSGVEFMDVADAKPLPRRVRRMLEKHPLNSDVLRKKLSSE